MMKVKDLSAKAVMTTGSFMTGLDSLLRLRVERLAELHDVQAALTQRGTDRRRRVGLACRHLQLDEADDLLGHDWLLEPSDGHVDPVESNARLVQCELPGSS
jgi:hypothetical protein